MKGSNERKVNLRGWEGDAVDKAFGMAEAALLLAIRETKSQNLGSPLQFQISLQRLKEARMWYEEFWRNLG